MLTLFKWSIQDYHHLIEQGFLEEKKIELLDGNLVIIPPESPLHSYINRTSAEYLRRALKGLALVIEAHPITLSCSEPEPDIAIVAPPQKRYQERHPQAEDIFWLIEISNTTQDYDLNQKKQVYAAEGVKEYWVADVSKRQLTVFRKPINEDYTLQQIYSTGIISAEAFPQIELSIQELFDWSSLTKSAPLTKDNDL